MDFIEGKIKTFLDVNLLGGDRKLLWVNPDCGLKTREWSQVSRMRCHSCLRLAYFPNARVLVATPDVVCSPCAGA